MKYYAVFSTETPKAESMLVAVFYEVSNGDVLRMISMEIICGDIVLESESVFDNKNEMKSLAENAIDGVGSLQKFVGEIGIVREVGESYFNVIWNSLRSNLN